MRDVTVVYHFEDGSWWAEADEAPGFVAGASTFEQMRTLTREGLALEFDEPVALDERFDAAAFAARRAAVTVHASGVDLASTGRSSSASGTAPLVARPPHPQ